MAYAFSFPLRSEERKTLLEQLRNKGDFKHNTEVLEKGRGQIVTWKQPSDKASSRAWSEEERRAVYKHRGKFLTERRVPGKLHEMPRRGKVPEGKILERR